MKDKSVFLSVFLLLLIAFSNCSDRNNSSSSKNDPIDYSSPEIVAKGFWNVLKANNADKAKMFYLTIEESKAFPSEVSSKYANLYNREMTQIKSHLQTAKDTNWKEFKIDEEEYLAGHKGVEGTIILERSGEYEITIGLYIVQVSANIWKITDAD